MILDTRHGSPRENDQPTLSLFRKHRRLAKKTRQEGNKTITLRCQFYGFGLMLLWSDQKYVYIYDNTIENSEKNRRLFHATEYITRLP